MMISTPVTKLKVIHDEVACAKPNSNGGIHPPWWLKAKPSSTAHTRHNQNRPARCPITKNGVIGNTISQAN